MERANSKFVEVTENNLYDNNVTCQEAAYLDASILSRPTCFFVPRKKQPRPDSRLDKQGYK